MFAVLSREGRVRRSGGAVAAAIGVLAVCGGAAADNRCENNLCRPIGGHRGSSRTSVSINIGGGSCATGWGVGYSYGRGYCNDWCAPRCESRVIVRDYCPPPVVVRSYCPPPVIVRDYCAPTVVVREEPTVVERVVERPVYVDRVVEKPVVVERQVEKPVYVQQAPPQADQAGGYRDRELGDAYMRMSDWGNAVRVYQRYLAAWDKDGTATRNLGLAQIGAGQVQEGFRNVVRGHQLEPTLMDRALRISDFGGPSGLQDLVDAAVRGADGTNTAEGWFTVAWLQVIAGRNDAAVNAIKKARDAGLSNDLLDKLTLRAGSAAS